MAYIVSRLISVDVVPKSGYRRFTERKKNLTRFLPFLGDEWPCAQQNNLKFSGEGGAGDGLFSAHLHGKGPG